VTIFSEDFPPNVGGIAQWAYGVANAIHKLSHHVHVLTRYHRTYPPIPENVMSYPVEYMKGNYWKQLRTWYCYRGMKRSFHMGNKPDLIIATTWNFTRGIITIAKKYSINLVTVVHGLDVTRKITRTKKWWLSNTLNASDLVVAVSKFTRDYVLNNYSISPDKIFVLPNGVDIKSFYPGVDTSELRSRYHLDNKKVILTLARITERKGHDTVIKALPRVLEKIPDLKYLICGPLRGRHPQYLKKLISDLNLEKIVNFTGYLALDQLNAFYNLCDVYVMPNRDVISKGDTEGFGITFLEANACEKPVIGGNSGGVTDAIVDGETGFLVDPLDTIEIAKKLILLLSDKKLSEKMGIQGRKRIENQFTWDIVANKIINTVFEL